MTSSIDEETRKEPGAAPPTSPRLRGEGRSTRLVALAEKFGLAVLLVVLLLIFSTTSEHFFTLANFQAVLGDRAALSLLALATIVPLAAGHLDFSVGATMGVSSIVAATAMSEHGLSPTVAIALAIGCGALIGVLNGLLIAKVAYNSLIVTLGISTVLQGLVQWQTEGNAISTGISVRLLDAASGQWLGIPRGLLWLLPVAVLLWYVLEHTPFGRYIASLGANPSASRLVGLPVDRLVISSFVISGVIAALAGVLAVAQTGVGDPQTSLGTLLLPAYAAAFLGCSAFRPGRFNVAGTLLAVYLVAFTVSGLVFAGAQSWVEPVFNGLTLVGAVSMSSILARRRAAGALP